MMLVLQLHNKKGLREGPFFLPGWDALPSLKG